MTVARIYKVRMLAVVAFVVLYTLLSIVPVPSGAKPTSFEPRYEDDCQSKEDVEMLCQRCAKSTKSPLVYPMCCSNTEEVQEWCLSYMHYGLQ